MHLLNSCVFEVLKHYAMKKSIIMFSILCCASSSSISQSTKILSDSYLSTDASGIDKRAYINELNTKAVRDFSKTYSKAENIRWYTVSDGFIVYYLLDGVKARSAYNPRGDWTYTIRWLDEFKLPGSVRHLVKSTYYDYAIRLVVEIASKKQKYYEVQMEGKASLVTVVVADGEMEVKEELRKN
jgi:hypothetical protein